MTCPRPALACEKFGALRLPTDEAGQPRGLRRVETALALGHAERRESLDRLGEALDSVPAQILQPKAVAEQPSRRRRHDDAARLG